MTLKLRRVRSEPFVAKEIPFLRKTIQNSCLEEVRHRISRADVSKIFNSIVVRL